MELFDLLKEMAGIPAGHPVCVRPENKQYLIDNGFIKEEKKNAASKENKEASKRKTK